MGMDWRDRSFQIDKPEVGLSKYIRDIGKKQIPSAVIGRGRRLGGGAVFWFRGRFFLPFRRALILRGRRLHHGLVGNDVPCRGESDAADFLRIGAFQGSVYRRPVLFPSVNRYAQKEKK